MVGVGSWGVGAPGKSTVYCPRADAGVCKLAEAGKEEKNQI